MNELCEMELTGRYEEKLSALKAEISDEDIKKLFELILEG